MLRRGSPQGCPTHVLMKPMRLPQTKSKTKSLVKSGSVTRPNRHQAGRNARTSTSESFPKMTPMPHSLMTRPPSTATPLPMTMKPPPSNMSKFPRKRKKTLARTPKPSAKDSARNIGRQPTSTSSNLTSNGFHPPISNIVRLLPPLEVASRICPWSLRGARWG
ncbi:hypothetical protein K432DRAFT_464446 [Lepidopterella palustris CBS 459.81]|uniref:Uncharacterized protein n=1 Tax=Lepidopterella palustris CBS 459.81 TaxID=1314670 RepID=A0A8E2E246_9PEZI|nr:hypothetical protein K432DRAFT_464446 [Lepidopterella palustris CBS 459.81]